MPDGNAGEDVHLELKQLLKDWGTLFSLVALGFSAIYWVGKTEEKIEGKADSVLIAEIKGELNILNRQSGIEAINKEKISALNELNGALQQALEKIKEKQLLIESMRVSNNAQLVWHEIKPDDINEFDAKCQYFLQPFDTRDKLPQSYYVTQVHEKHLHSTDVTIKISDSDGSFFQYETPDNHLFPIRVFRNCPKFETQK